MQENYLSDLIQSLGIIITLILAIWQMRVQTKHVRASNELALLIKFDEINKLWIEHPGLWKRLQDEYQQGASGDVMKVLENTVFITFNTFELVFRHHTYYGLIRDDWADWEASIAAYLDKPYVKGWWAQNHEEYGKAFQAFADRLVHPAP